MASNLDFLVAFLMGILPGLLILWASLRRFDRPYVDHTLFDDRRVFGSLAVGLIFGTVASIIAIVLPRGDLASFAVAVAVSFVFEESFKLVWLNRRSYRGRFDTTFYGVPLGIGAAASGVVARQRLGIEGYGPEETGLRFEDGILLDQRGERFSRVWDSQAGEDPLPIGQREDLEFPRELDRGGSHPTCAVAPLPGDGDDANVGIAGAPPTDRRLGPPILFGATRELRAHLPHERCELARALGSAADSRRDDVNVKPALTRRRLLLEVHSFRALASRADDDSVHAQARNTSAARHAP